MKAEKIRNLTDAELKHQERDLADQLFKLKFQLNMGQTESLKKIRGLRKDIARVKTILREQEVASAVWPGDFDPQEVLCPRREERGSRRRFCPARRVASAFEAEAVETG